MHIKFSQTLSLYMLFSLKHNKYGPSLGSGEVYSIQHYAIKFVSDLQQVGGSLTSSGNMVINPSETVNFMVHSETVYNALG
jgi:hypothetical protein